MISNDSPLAVKVLPKIWLGNYKSANSSLLINKENIKAVLNVTPDVPNYYVDRHDIEYMRVPLHDSKEKRDTQLFYKYLPVITEFMYKNTVLEEKNILVHCHVGRQRSAACVAAYLIKYYHMNPNQAVDFLVDKKPDAFHWGKSVNFASSLEKFYEYK